MIKTQKNKFAMYDAVSAYLDDNSSKFLLNEELNTHHASFKEALDAIAGREDLRNKSTKGRTQEKTVTRASVTSQALAIAGALYAYAKKSGNISLRESVKYTHTSLDSQRDNVLIIELNSLKDKAIENKGILEKYDITPEKLEKYTSNIESYSNALGARSTGKASKSGAIKSLVTLFRDASSILDSIDRLMENYNVGEEQFYSGYKAARVIMDLGKRHKAEVEKTEQPTVVNT
ncbi:MAG: hypothetical protein ABI462_14215 [Ignavibacteria bacterium]